MRHGVKRSRAEIDSERNLITSGSLQSAVWHAVRSIRVFLNNLGTCHIVPVRIASQKKDWGGGLQKMTQGAPLLG